MCNIICAHFDGSSYFCLLVYASRELAFQNKLHFPSSLVHSRTLMRKALTDDIAAFMSSSPKRGRGRFNASYGLVARRTTRRGFLLCVAAIDDLITRPSVHLCGHLNIHTRTRGVPRVLGPFAMRHSRNYSHGVQTLLNFRR